MISLVKLSNKLSWSILQIMLYKNAKIQAKHEHYIVINAYFGIHLSKAII